MGRILVLYHSNDGNTEAMSELVAEGAGTIPGHEIRRRSCDEASHEDVRWADGIACGGPTNLGGMAWRLMKFWDEFAADNWGKCDGKFFVVFSSQGGHGGGAEHTCQAMTTVLENFGWMHCPVTDYVSPIHTLHYGACVAKMPRNEEDKAVCRRLGLRLAEWVAVFVDGRKSLHPLLTTKRVDAIKEEHFRAAKEAKKKGLPPPPEPDVSTKPDIPDWNPHNAVHVVVVKDVPIDAQADWLAMAEKLAMGTWREDGCLKYNFIRSSSSPTRFVINEEWESQAHLDAHFETPHFKDLVPKMDAISCTVSIDVCHDALARYAPRVAPGSVPAGAISGPVRRSALVFTKATDYQHDSRVPAAKCIEGILREKGWEVTVSEDSAYLEAGHPSTYDLVVLVNNSGQIFNPEQTTLKDHVARGKAVIGLHAALASFLNGEDASGATELGATTTLIQDIFGAHFTNHPEPQTGEVNVAHSDSMDDLSEAFRALPAKFSHHDEFFNFASNPVEVEGLKVLATVDEKSYEGGKHGDRHPVAWCRELGDKKAPVFYLALGHFTEFYGQEQRQGPIQRLLTAGVEFVENRLSGGKA